MHLGFTGSAVRLTWRELCNPDPLQPVTQLMYKCFQLCGGGNLSGKDLKTAWQPFNKTALDMWSSTRTFSGDAARKALISTANDNHIRMTLQLFATAVLSDPTAAVTSLTKFEGIAGSKISETRAEVEVREAQVLKPASSASVCQNFGKALYVYCLYHMCIHSMLSPPKQHPQLQPAFCRRTQT